MDLSSFAAGNSRRRRVALPILPTSHLAASIAGRHRSSGAGGIRNGPALFAGQPGLRNFSM
jgi:hypothetical protein